MNVFRFSLWPCIEALFLVSFLLASCSKSSESESQPVPDGTRISVSVPCYSQEGQNLTRTSLVEGDECISVLWAENDRIGVFGSIKGENQEYRLDEGKGTRNGVFATAISTDTPADGTLVAYYPYRAGEKVKYDPATSMLSGLEFQAVQTSNGAPDHTAAILVGKGENASTLVMNNLFTIVKIQYKGSQLLQQIQFSGLNKEVLNGAMRVNLKDFTTVFEEGVATTGQYTLTVNVSDQADQAGKSRAFYILLPARRFEKGFTVRLTALNGQVMTLRSSTSGGKEFLPSKTYPMQEVVFKPDVIYSTGLTLNRTTLTLAVGQTFTLKATLQPDDVTIPTVTWSLSDIPPAVASVNEQGVVTALRAGQTTVTARSADGHSSATCSINVIDNSNPDFGYEPPTDWD